MDLTPEQEAEAQRIFELLKDKADAELMAMARLLASKDTGELFGRTELEIRDRVHRIGAQALESALAGRKKGGTRAAALSADSATARPTSSATSRGG
jgi:predicted GNAT family N-acyltransferase